MVFYSIWPLYSSPTGKGYYTYVPPEQLGRENYFCDDVSWWVVPGTLGVNA